MVVLAVAIVYLTYSTIDGIKGPIEFDEESKSRYTEVEKKLEAIRNAQFTYKNVTGRYAKTWDSLFTVLNEDSITIQRKILIPKDKYQVAQYGVNPKVADDTSKYEVTFQTKVAIRDTILKTLGYPLDELQFIPFSDGATFYLNADVVEAGGGRIKVPVFMVTAPNRLILKGLDAKFYDPNAGYQMGSMLETTTEFSYKRDGVVYE
jgi:hypothetical protein